MKWYLIFALIASMSHAAPCTKSASCSGSLTFSTGKKLIYYRNYPLGTKRQDITGAVVVVHGSERNANVYYDYMMSAVGSIPSVFVTAPFFDDAEKANYHHWTTAGWRKGDDSSDSVPFSSYAVMDEIIEKILSSYPKVRSITIVGHSAGGQYVNRYVGGGRDPSRAVKMRYVVMNPSSYLYVDSRRPNDSSNCPGFNRYHYGLDNRNNYMKDKDIFANYVKRDFWLLVGALDTVIDDSLDVTCPALIQGKNRLERARNYRAYVETFRAWNERMTYIEVPDVGHSAKKMLKASTSVIFAK